jgi:hypothetical protein
MCINTGIIYAIAGIYKYPCKWFYFYSNFINMRKRDTVLEESLDKANNHKISVLHGQVLEIKQSAEAIHEEVKSSNNILNTLSDSFDKGKKNVKSVYSRFENMLQEKNNRLSIYIGGILTILFIIIWKYMLG